MYVDDKLSRLSLFAHKQSITTLFFSIRRALMLALVLAGVGATVCGGLGLGGEPALPHLASVLLGLGRLDAASVLLRHLLRHLKRGVKSQ